MDFASVRIITEDIKQLVGFYEKATGLTAQWFTEDFAEIATQSCTLAIGSIRTLALFGDAGVVPATNKSNFLEFRVDDVDAEYVRLQGVVDDIVQEPTTMPWGNRSILIRDPDGNLVNFFTPVSPEAKKKFGI